MTGHSAVAPSGAHRWLKCAASVAAALRNPQPDSAASRDGTAAHWAAGEMLQGRSVAAGQIAPNGVEIDDEMLDAACVYLDDVQAVLRQLQPDARPVIEQSMPIVRIHADCHGTPDAWVVSATLDGERVLVVWDFKYGHRPVYADENPQLICYVAGILEALDVTGIQDQALTVSMRVVQPRSYHRRGGPVDVWNVRASDLRGWVNRLSGAAGMAMLGDGTAVAGSHCRDCPGLHDCDAAQRAALSICDEPGSPLPVTLSAQALGAEIRYLRRGAELVGERLEALEAQAQAMIGRGEPVPGLVMEPGRSRKVWTIEPAKVILYGQTLGLDLAKPATVTPTQAAKAGVPDAVLSTITEARPGALKLVEADHRDARVFRADNVPSLGV